jgi:hypothetical protein
VHNSSWVRCQSKHLWIHTRNGVMKRSFITLLLPLFRAYMASLGRTDCTGVILCTCLVILELHLSALVRCLQPLPRLCYTMQHITQDVRIYQSFTMKFAKEGCQLCSEVSFEWRLCCRAPEFLLCVQKERCTFNSRNRSKSHICYWLHVMTKEAIAEQGGVD